MALMGGLALAVFQIPRHDLSSTLPSANVTVIDLAGSLEFQLATP